MIVEAGMPVLEDGVVEISEACFTNQVGRLAVGHALSVFICCWRALLSIRREVCQLPLKNNDKFPSKSFDDHLQQMSVLVWKFISGLSDSFSSWLISNAKCIQLIWNVFLLPVASLGIDAFASASHAWAE